ncbi:hypothetical protein D5S17_23700 [Pseudonocardiaceae bacterium YIM PH 21723]|nr:hypothetical protein D5S17_23700 [Pseudonocardiaceae bacterium YIM PH 21723]
MHIKDLIDEGVLSDARKIDKFAIKHGAGAPSIENTLRIIRDVDTDTLRRIGNDVWGVGGSGGGDLVRHKLEDCVGLLTKATVEASTWTGNANNAYKVRIDKTIATVNGMKSTSEDVGQSMVKMADQFDQIFGRSWADILTIIGLIMAIIGVVVAVLTGWSGVGAVVGLILAVIGLITAAASYYISVHDLEEKKIKSVEEAAAAAVKTMESLNKATP